jgi:hypothetical protein
MEHDPAAGGSSGSDNKPASPEDRSKVSATSMFDVVPAAGPPVAPPVPAPVPEPPAPSAAPAQPSFQAAEIPVVHEVVFPASAAGAEGSPSILSTLRNLAADEKVRAAELPPSSFVKSELPPQKPDSANTFVKSPASSGFTQLLQAISENPAAPSVAPPPSPPPIQTNPAPSQASSSAASFTRLLRALDADQASPPIPSVTAPPAQVEPSRPGAQTRYTTPAENPATSILRTPESAAKPTSPPVAPTAVFQSPFLQSAPSSEPKIDSSSRSAGSFTQLFQALDPKAPDQPAQQAQRAQPAPTAQPSSTPPPVASPDSPKSPGTFTQFFSAIDPPITPAPSAPTPATAIHQSAATPPPPADPAAGSFTQLFQAIDQGSAPAKTSIRPEPQSPAMPAVPETNSPGSFTQLFQAVGSSATEPPPAAPRSFNPPPTPANTHPTPPGGSFTELFRAIDPGTNPQPPAPIAQRPPSTMATVPANNPEPPPASSFTQIFRAIEGTPPSSAGENPPQTWGQAPQSQNAPIVPPPYAPPVSEAPRSEGSNLTQLLRNLDQSGSVEPLPPPPARKPDAFTSLYGERQSPINQVERMQSASPATNVVQPPRTDFAAVPGRTAPPEPAAGASDFTRIIQASSLREQALRQGEQSIEAPKPAASAAPAAPMPSQPPIPGFPGAAPPQFPHPSVLPPLNFGQGGAMPPAQPFRAPNLAPPQWMPPAPQPPAPAPPAKAQPLLPLILIGIIFLLIVVLVAVIFLMKR